MSFPSLLLPSYVSAESHMTEGEQEDLFCLLAVAMVNHGLWAPLMMAFYSCCNSGSTYSELIEPTLNTCSETENSVTYFRVCWLWVSFLTRSLLNLLSETGIWSSSVLSKCILVCSVKTILLTSDALCQSSSICWDVCMTPLHAMDIKICRNLKSAEICWSFVF